MTGALPPDLLRGLTQPRLSRRRLLQLGGLSLLGAAVSSGLAGCSIAAARIDPVAKSADGIEKFWARQKKTDQLNFANWSLYIDVAAHNQNDHPSLDLFTKRTGIKVNYQEVIADDDSFFGKIQPQLADQQSLGYDLMVITNGRYLDLLIELNYLIPLDQHAMPNFNKYASNLVVNPSFDPGNKYTMAWQSGITGIGYDPRRTGREINSWQDLQDPKFKGRVGMFGDTEDLPNSAIVAVGAKPETSTPADWKRAADWLVKQQPLVRKYYEQDYVEPLTKGDIWISMAWSGDIFQANAGSGSHLKFVVPKEGGVIWTDNMCIPQFAANPRAAMTYADFVYQPPIAAMIADYVNYITPVPSTQAIFKKDAEDATSKDDKEYYTTLSTSPLVFPQPSEFAKLHRYRVLKTQDEINTWNNLFEPVYQS